MGAGTLDDGLNKVFPIYNQDGTPFEHLVIKKATVESIVMSLGDKIYGDVLYRNNSLAVTMNEYIEHNDVHYVLVSPPTIVREGTVSDNSELKGMTKYSFVFYHPMYKLGNFPFSDIAINSEEEKYLSQNKTFSWIGNLFDFRDKLNANLASTEWLVVIDIPQYEQDGVTETQQWKKANELSDVLSFDKQFVSDALKTGYDTWEIPFTITSTNQTVNGVTKKFLITFGLPSQEIYDEDGVTPFVFQFGQGVGLKNNSRTPKNNKIITRLSGIGSDRNIPYGYPQIVWTGNQSWDYTINNDSTAANSYPIYDGIVGGQKVRLIKHPFTRTTLMPTVYVDSVNRKVNPNATGYDPNTVIIDYHDADNSYPNPINLQAPSYETHQFEDVYPRMSDSAIVNAAPYDDATYLSYSEFLTLVDSKIAAATNEKEKDALGLFFAGFVEETSDFSASNTGGSYTYAIKGIYHQYQDGKWFELKYTSDNANIKCNAYIGTHSPSYYTSWDDSMNEDGEYVQSYMKLTLPQLSFDIYACASITEDMKIYMRSGGCIGCTFPIQVDWDDYKANFYRPDGTFDPVIHTTDGDGHVRDGVKYPDSSQGQITVIAQKDNETFGTLMPNRYQTISSGDSFVILGISLPTSYITTAQQELDGDIDEYILENNVHYYEYPLKFDEYFFATHTGILSQIKNNSIMRFLYNGVENALYIKQIIIKYGEGVLPKYDITLTDDVEVVLNSIGQVTDDVSRIRVQLNELQKFYGEDVVNQIAGKLSRLVDDICLGRITFQSGLDSIGSAIFHDELHSQDFTSGLYTGRGWRVDQLGNAEFESIRARSFLEVVELLVNRMQAQEGDTAFSDNDQIDKVDKVVEGGVTSYILSLKEKWSGYVTAQKVDNILKGIVNTLAAKGAGVSDESGNNPDKQGKDDGDNKYYTSWMRVINTQATKGSLGANQIEVVLYGDSDVPANKNFEPCELMTIARWGCAADPDEEGITEAEKQSRIRRARLFMISTSDGRVVKYTGVKTPKLLDGNYGVTIGELPQFVKDYPRVHDILFGYDDAWGNHHEGVGEHSDWLYAQGIVVENLIQVDKQGLPANNYIDCGEWVDGSQIQNPTLRHGIYTVYTFNENTGQYETHDVWHNGQKWRCLQNQPVVSGGVSKYHEPKWNSPYWRMIEGNDNYSLEFESSNGYSFRRGYVDTVITPYLFYGNTDISGVISASHWNWTRSSESGKTYDDSAWDAKHTGAGTQQKTLHITNNDMPSNWSSANKAIFTCTVTITNNGVTMTVSNQIIA